MDLSLFDFNLPKHLIAQEPLKKRDSSNLLVLNRKEQRIQHKKFFNIVSYLNEGDVLVLNNSKVFKARLVGYKDVTFAKIELLLLKRLSLEDETLWEVLIKPAKRVKLQTSIFFSQDFSCVVTEVKGEGIYIVKFQLPKNLSFFKLLDKLGNVPLPPYISLKGNAKLKSLADMYQTVYAKKVGSAAAPTAGFHFTKELLLAIEKKGVKIVFVTLHVGLGTFKPVKTDDITLHKMHSEFYQIDLKTALLINKAKESGKKVVAVGTTVVRTLETVFLKYKCLKECSGFTDIFIYPGFEFKVVDFLVTNFHLPKSTLLMLVSAFASRELIMKAYEEAIVRKYRFFSFGDAMLIL